uniref:Putative secreted protein n=1 Tax=Ixodes ricinus TaxID=34613 RepID=A0A6B0UHT9_IXORI
MMTKSFWMCILMMALPIRVAPKKVQKGTRKWPHVMPARSNSGFGIDAQARIPRNPTLSTSFSTASLALSRKDRSLDFSFSMSSSSSSRSSRSSLPESLAAFAMK